MIHIPYSTYQHWKVIGKIKSKFANYELRILRF